MYLHRVLHLPPVPCAIKRSLSEKTPGSKLPKGLHMYVQAAYSIFDVSHAEKTLSNSAPGFVVLAGFPATFGLFRLMSSKQIRPIQM